jgi:hypothetical protein
LPNLVALAPKAIHSLLPDCVAQRTTRRPGFEAHQSVIFFRKRMAMLLCIIDIRCIVFCFSFKVDGFRTLDFNMEHFFCFKAAKKLGLIGQPQNLFRRRTGLPDFP